MMHLLSTEPSDLKGYLTLLGGFTMHLACGALYMWGTLNVYITSYFRLVDDPTLSIETGASIFPVMMCCVATGMPLGVRAVKRFRSARLYCYCAGAAATFCIYISSFVLSFYQFILIYGIMFGIITGTMYYIPIYMGSLYFPKKKGLVSGIILMGYGLCSLIFGLTFFSLVNPNNMKPIYDEEHINKYFYGESEEVARNVPKVLRKLCQYYILLFMVAYNQSQSKYQKEISASTTTGGLVPAKKKDDHDNHHYPLPCPRPKIAVKTQQFYVSLLVGILSLGLGLLVNGNYKTIGKKATSDDSFLTICGAFASIANGVSRPLWSSLLDKYSFRNIFSKLLIFEIILAFIYRLAFIHKFIYLVWVFACHTAFGGIMAMFPVLAGQLFGTKVSSLLYGVYWYGFGISNFIQFLMVYNLSKKYSFELIVYIDGIFALLCLGIIRFYNLKTDWSKYYNQAGELIKK
ncbi:major facilitator superfamily protein, putative [Ichthyophthirius multifiliis]|uniref:Major facilitator superfamily protein, putative n=1 Tax=Ichthyophthirius multifiliis TaxID=5932 RepID=G0R076_ICHMU|nr:major facilitator superfamily protein, putative [Ichthyophthirius multifiliis]EGR29136.1 major facilitator superfamily protein, putative [Ichthyophthirius multifiliis]|eukprot:XP_004030372.1 major facilitator superfamily protein, putative [Ichthyophthirius multifiliis]